MLDTARSTPSTVHREPAAGSEQGQVRGAVEKGHEGDVAGHGDESVGEVEAEALDEEGGGEAAIAPGEM